MSRIEELPDDFDESINLNKEPAAPTDNKDVSMDDLFERAMAQGGYGNKTFEEAMLDISKTPLFMTSLDDAGDENGQNDILEALKALQYEGTKSEVAQNFKEQGNEAVQAKQWKDAKEFYTKGIAVLLSKEDHRWEQPEDAQEEVRKCHLLDEQLHINRARCNLELKNYRSTTLDCAAALRVNPNNVKAHYRSASALFALDKVYEALDVSYRGLQLDTKNAPMKKLMEQIQKRSRVKENQDRQRKAEIERKKKEDIVLATALKARNIVMRGSPKPPDMEDAVVRLAPDPLSPTSVLEFPLMFLYPMHNQSDFIKAFGERDLVSDHLSYMFPLPWDTTNQYKMASVDCFMDTISGGLMKVGKNVSLLEVLSGGKTEVIDGLVKIHVLPRALAAGWIDEVKRKKGK